MTADLIERLRAMYSHRGDGLPTQCVNPDGPEAADEIAALRERVAVLEAALAYVADTLRRQHSASPGHVSNAGKVNAVLAKARDLLTPESDNADAS